MRPLRLWLLARRTLRAQFNSAGGHHLPALNHDFFDEDELELAVREERCLGDALAHVSSARLGGVEVLAAFLGRLGETNEVYAMFAEQNASLPMHARFNLVYQEQAGEERAPGEPMPHALEAEGWWWFREGSLGAHVHACRVEAGWGPTRCLR